MPRVARWVGWIVVVWVVVFWRLGYPSFWDPGDEAHYAQASREMLAAHDWLAPVYNGHPFFDKPPLFYLLQIVAFSIMGPTELAARMVPACSAIALFVGTWWLGSRFFSRRVGAMGTLMLALLPGTFALSSYGILDMTFTAILFSGVALVAVAALRERPRLQYPGYILLALAVLTKGPLALALTGLTLLVAMVIAPEIRQPIRRLHWWRGLAVILACTAPWFIYMWWRFGYAFTEGYLLRENVWLYTRGIAGPGGEAPTTHGVQLSYVRVVLVGLLPWTTVLAGRLVDIARGDKVPVEERLLWAWAVSVIGFFMCSQFKLDHYIYPAAPALCLLTAQAWTRVREASSIRPHAGAAVGLVGAGVALAFGGVALIVLGARTPLALSRWVWLVPAAFTVSGVVFVGRLAWRRWRPPAAPAGMVVSFLLLYSVALVLVLPHLEEAKPVRDLGRWTGAQVTASPVGAYRMDRWNTSWRFYVEHPVEEMNTPDQLNEFLAQPGPRYCLMLKRDMDVIRAGGAPIWIAREAQGLFTTSGRAMSKPGGANWQTFVVVSNVAPR